MNVIIEQKDISRWLINKHLESKTKAVFNYLINHFHKNTETQADSSDVTLQDKQKLIDFLKDVIESDFSELEVYHFTSNPHVVVYRKTNREGRWALNVIPLDEDTIKLDFFCLVSEE